MRKRVGLVLICLVASPGVAFAGTELQTAIASYNSGAYALALKHSLAAIAVDKNDVTAHYYAGNCYLRLGRNDDATKEYSACLSLQKDGPVAEHARTALESLARTTQSGTVTAAGVRGGGAGNQQQGSAISGPPSLKPAPQTSGVPPSLSAKPSLSATEAPAGVPNTPSNSGGAKVGNSVSHTNEPQQLDSGRIKRETFEKKMEMTSSEVTTLKHKQRLAEEAIKRINEGVDHALEGIPKMVPTGKRGEMEENEDYTHAESALRKDADKKIEVIRRDLQSYRERLKAETESAKSAVDMHESNLKSQLNVGSSNSRLTPQGTGVYVRNYVNFGQRSEKIILRKPVPEQLKGTMEKISNQKQTSGK
ncbi:MAG: hypothetical protein K2W95_19055 [Candidatus Obscuribacterales bacterium]|nr:hypothetical protein [Candidatus Obscuribacterales bacterium]